MFMYKSKVNKFLRLVRSSIRSFRMLVCSSVVQDFDRFCILIVWLAYSVRSTEPRKTARSNSID